MSYTILVGAHCISTVLCVCYLDKLTHRQKDGQKLEFMYTDSLKVCIYITSYSWIISVNEANVESRHSESSISAIMPNS